MASLPSSSSSKPVVKAIGREHFSVRFPCGGYAEVYRVYDRGVPVGYSFEGEKSNGTRVMRYGPRFDTDQEAFRRAWCEVVATPAPLPMNVDELYELAARCENDRTLFNKTVKRILFERTGYRFTVRSGQRSSYSRIENDESIEQRVAMASVFGASHATSLSVSPRKNDRFRIVCVAAGFPMPEGMKVEEPDYG